MLTLKTKGLTFCCFFPQYLSPLPSHLSCHIFKSCRVKSVWVHIFSLHPVHLWLKYNVAWIVKCEMVIPHLTLGYLNIKSGLQGIQMCSAVQVMHEVIFTKGKRVMHEKYGCVWVNAWVFACTLQSRTMQWIYCCILRKINIKILNWALLIVTPKSQRLTARSWVVTVCHNLSPENDKSHCLFFLAWDIGHYIQFLAVELLLWLKL